MKTKTAEVHKPHRVHHCIHKLSEIDTQKTQTFQNRHSLLDTVSNIAISCRLVFVFKPLSLRLLFSLDLLLKLLLLLLNAINDVHQFKVAWAGNLC